MNDFNIENEQQCKDAVNDILSENILSPTRILHLVEKYNELYEDVQYRQEGEMGNFFHLYMKLCEFYGLTIKRASAKKALDEYSQICHLSNGNILKWLVKYEDDGLYLRETVKKTKLEDYDQLPNGSVLLHNDFKVRVELGSFIPVLDFVLTFNDYYDTEMDKYRSVNDEETYMECGVEYYKSNNEQRRLMDFVKHLINPPIEDLFSGPDISLDFNKLKNYVPLKVEQHSSTPSIELQAAHDLFHQNFFAEAKLKYSILLDSRNDYQEAWLGLTICNFIIGDYEGAYIASSNLYIFRYRDLINYIEKYRQNDNKSEIEFLISDKTCEEAVKEFNSKTNKLIWLAENRDLYNSISIRPKGLPSIASCCLNGIHYENISVFHRTYCDAQIDENILDTKTHLEAVIHFIEKMDIQKLDELLLKGTYSSISKDTFMKQLSGVFDDLNNSGDTVLYSEPGVCQGCQNGCGGFTFFSNNSRNYIEVVIKSEDEKVTDIFECSQFKNDNLVQSMLGKRIKFDPYEAPF
jgi:hypothetical protein